MRYLNLSLEVQEGFKFNRQAEALAAEIQDMMSRLEEDPGFTDEDRFIVGTLEGDHEGADGVENLDFYAGTVADLSSYFPDLVFALDAYDKMTSDHVFRWYFRDGRRQVVKPVTFVEAFNPLALEEV